MSAMAGREDERFPIGAGTIAWPNPLAINLDSPGRDSEEQSVLKTTSMSIFRILHSRTALPVKFGLNIRKL